MHRLIVTSAAYRMSSTPEKNNFAVDPDNTYLWRMPSRRMEGEIVRDNLLWIAGRMDPEMGGPDIDHKTAQESRRRSIYLRHGREKLVEFVQIFDGPKVSECYIREESVQPHQALAMANSKLVLAQSRLLARKLAKSSGATSSDFIRAGFAHVLCRAPAPTELQLCDEFLTKQTAAFKSGKGLTKFTNGPRSALPPSTDPVMRARENLIHVLFNHNEFVTIR